MPLTSAQSGRIGEYVERKDREAEPVFVGREDLFTLAAGNAHAATRGHGKGRTVCIAVPPGIGKTAFLSTLAKRSAKFAWGGPSTACIEIGPGGHGPHSREHHPLHRRHACLPALCN